MNDARLVGGHLLWAACMEGKCMGAACSPSPRVHLSLFKPGMKSPSLRDPLASWVPGKVLPPEDVGH